MRLMPAGRVIETDSGRLDLSELRCRNICLQISQINWIFVIAGMPRKCELIDIKVTTSSGLVGVGGKVSADHPEDWGIAAKR